MCVIDWNRSITNNGTQTHTHTEWEIEKARLREFFLPFSLALNVEYFNFSVFVAICLICSRFLLLLSSLYPVFFWWCEQQLKSSIFFRCSCCCLDHVCGSVWVCVCGKNQIDYHELKPLFSFTPALDCSFSLHIKPIQSHQINEAK